MSEEEAHRRNDEDEYSSSSSSSGSVSEGEEVKEEEEEEVEFNEQTIGPLLTKENTVKNIYQSKKNKIIHHSQSIIHFSFFF